MARNRHTVPPVWPTSANPIFRVDDEVKMTGEEVFRILTQMAAKGTSPRRREKQLQKLAEKSGQSSDALRAKARRYARKMGLPYPLMRRQGEGEAPTSTDERREARETVRADRIRLGRAALDTGADWAELARIFGIKTPEGAAQWWRRNVEGVKAPRRSRRRRGRRGRRATATPGASPGP
jgi:hypothetical protein